LLYGGAFPIARGPWKRFMRFSRTTSTAEMPTPGWTESRKNNLQWPPPRPLAAEQGAAAVSSRPDNCFVCSA
jgi:hypothetical protein